MSSTLSKLLVCAMLQSKGKARLPGFKSLRLFLRQCHHNRLLAVPAGLYSVNNYLKFAMQLYFKPTTAKMLSNLKVRTCFSSS